MIKVGIIGTGKIAETHLKAYAEFSERCRVVALANPGMDKAAALRDRFGLDCRLVQDYRELLRDGELDLVSICAPPHLHAEIAVNCLEAGVHVLIEKPMAMSLAECDRMLEAQASSGRLLSVVGQERFVDKNVKLKAVLESGLIGRIVHAQVESYWWRGRSYYDVWWRGSWEREGGGCTLNHGVHHMDLLQWMMGMPRSVQAVMSNTSHPNSELEDLSIAVFVYDGGALAQMTSSVVHHGEERQMVFQGERARVSAPWKVYASQELEDGFPVRHPKLEEEIEQFAGESETLKYDAHTGQVDDVLTAIENGSLKVLIDGHEGRKTLELITAVYEAAITGGRVELPLSPDSRFYTREGFLAAVSAYPLPERPKMSAPKASAIPANAESGGEA
ncbi:Gfo/Idh/MocA family protein [Paenibacillus physcomitrellae]|uniref:Oxidoreductase n=1 Tax=Paenibacillus physcomitrellae TaxID=1619311 RepID=A0ABQ1GQV8_9BACL|nr:Gfo/Idh/MocA family oxidoreductase [Paenibacillus physcomitrellae]GGA48280.1 oxidoreductase [Paenibacillus physcomitrellae]